MEVVIPAASAILKPVVIKAMGDLFILVKHRINEQDGDHLKTLKEFLEKLDLQVKLEAVKALIEDLHPSMSSNQIALKYLHESATKINKLLVAGSGSSSGISGFIGTTTSILTIL